MDEIPCNSNNWVENTSGSVHTTPPAEGTSVSGWLTAEGTIEIPAKFHEAGIITPGSGPEHRGFRSQPGSDKLIISAPVVASLLQSMY